LAMLARSTSSNKVMASQLVNVELLVVPQKCAALGLALKYHDIYQRWQVFVVLLLLSCFPN
jgi:hypothetical protein